jgi:hypothetical protein
VLVTSVSASSLERVIKVAKYEARTVLNTFAWIEIEADSQEEAERIANEGGWAGWRFDTAMDSAGDIDVELAVE